VNLLTSYVISKLAGLRANLERQTADPPVLFSSTVCNLSPVGNHQMSALKDLLQRYRECSQTERDKGAYFERLIQSYLKNDPKYDFQDVWLWNEWAESHGKDARDVGIDLVAQDRETKESWAVQCKFYAEDTKIYKRHIDSFFTESGKAPFARRLIVISTNATSEHDG